jgi:FkbM family methyltransferase
MKTEDKRPMTGSVRSIRRSEVVPDTLTPQPAFGTYAPGGWQRFLIGLAKKTVLHRGLFRDFMTRLIMGDEGRPMDVLFRGCAYRLLGQNNLIEYGILLHPKYNGADIDFLLEGAPADANFLDIGSNIGLYTLPLAKAAGSNGMVVAIDANPLMAHTLMWNAAASGIANIQMFACAVSDREGRGDLVVRKDDIAIVNLVEKDDGAVPVRTLASIIAQSGIGSIYGLKIDIEGHEDKALVPYFETAPESMLPQRIVIEHPEPEQDYPGCEKVFAAKGYKLTGRSRNNSFYARSGAP